MTTSPEPHDDATELREPTTEPPEERLPLGSWKRIYILVLGALALEILLFHLFTEAFR